MRLDFLLLADKAEALNGKLYLMGGGFDRVGITEAADAVHFDVALGVLVEYRETNLLQRFEVALEDADNKPILTAEVELEMGRPPGMVPGQDQRAIFVVRGPFPIKAPGQYSWVITIGGKRAEPTRFYVDKVAPPPGGVPPIQSQ